MHNYKDKELHRTEEDLFIIYLYQDKPNSDWYTAYEWSAYLMEFYNDKLSEDQRLNPIQYSTNNGNIIHVGLKASSFNKYLPDAIINSTECSKIIISIDPSKFPNIDNNNYKDKLSEWKSKVKVKSNQKKVRSETIYSNPTTFSSIMKSIISYDTHNKSEDDLREFIILLKSKCANLI